MRKWPGVTLSSERIQAKEKERSDVTVCLFCKQQGAIVAKQGKRKSRKKRRKLLRDANIVRIMPGMAFRELPPSPKKVVRTCHAQGSGTGV